MLKSEEMVAIEIIVFDCGHGDTILLKLPDEKWILIDCHLPRGPIRDRFFTLVAELKIERLDVLCLTHPHEDHYQGMLEVVKYFTSGGRSLGIYCDSGINPKEMLDLLRAKNRPRPYVKEYSVLQEHISELINKNAVRYYPGNQDSLPMLHNGPVSLQPIGPRAEVVRLMNRSYLSRSGEVPILREDLNLLSLILLLQVKAPTRTLNTLFPGDSKGDGIYKALDVLRERDGGKRRIFDILKVPHHGSSDSHQNSNLCDPNHKATPAIAVVSVGTEYDVLPFQTVLSCRTIWKRGGKFS
jgi:beta-lactamase superfamily II metal-dependent hydrolase